MRTFGGFCGHVEMPTRDSLEIHLSELGCTLLLLDWNAWVRWAKAELCPLLFARTVHKWCFRERGNLAALVQSTRISRGENGTLEVRFTDGHTSVFKLDNLVKELSDFRQNPIQPVSYDHPTRELWSTGHKISSFQYDKVIGDEETKFKLLRDLLVQWAVLVQGMPQEGGACVKFARQLSTMKETEWGLYFNIRAIPDAVGNTTMKDLAYTPKAIGLHTDNSFRYPAPDFQLLHALVHCTCGDKAAPCKECSVMNYMVDGFVIANQLKMENPEYYDLMSNVPVRFESTAGDGGSALLHVGPHFELELADAHGSKALKSLRFGAKAGQYAPPMEAETAAKFYKARRRFSELLHKLEYRVDYQLREGDMLILDNHRILHARSSILPSDGERNVQGGYMDRDGLELAYERLRRRYQ
eukprot:s1138_g15.t1